MYVMENSNNNRWVSPTPPYLFSSLCYIPTYFPMRGPVIKTSLCLQPTSPVWQNREHNREKRATKLPFITSLLWHLKLQGPCFSYDCQFVKKLPGFDSLQKHPHLPKFWLTTQWSVNNSMGPKQCQNFYLAH